MVAPQEIVRAAGNRLHCKELCARQEIGCAAGKYLNEDSNSLK
jgi:hypothetical protein